MNKKNFIFTSYISEILPEDKQLLARTVFQWRPHSKNYEDSWGYIIQATRYGGFKWYDPENNSLIFFGRKLNDDLTLVIPNFFTTPSYLVSVINKIQSELKVNKIILKNITVEDVNIFIKHGFREYKDNEYWSSLARFDDQTYPQLLVDLKQVTQHEGKIYHHLRKALRKDPYAMIRPYQDSDKNAVLEVFAARDGNTSKSTIEKSKGMYYESHMMYPSADLDKFVIIDSNSNEIIGFTAMSDITKTTAAFVTLLFKLGIGVVGVWGIYNTLLVMYQKGYTKVNFGGTETEGAFNFVWRTFRPIEKIKKMHLVYDIKKE